VSPRPFSVSAGNQTKFRHSQAVAISDLDPDQPVPALTGPVTVCPGSPEPLCRTLLPNCSKQDGIVPARVPGTENLTHELTGGPARSGNRNALPDHRPDHQCATLPRPPPIRKRSHGPGGHREMHARLGGTRQAGTRCPPRPVRGRPRNSRRCTPTVLTARTDRPSGTHARPLCVRGQRNMTADGATRRYTAGHRETARIAENSQQAGRFRWWWQVLGSNQRRLSRRFYRPLLLVRSHSL
jgi:hypothetical protein